MSVAWRAGNMSTSEGWAHLLFPATIVAGDLDWSGDESVVDLGAESHCVRVDSAGSGHDAAISE